MNNPAFLLLDLPDQDTTERLAARLADTVRNGDTILLEGPVGAAKTFLARSLIQTLQSRSGKVEDVPSPTFTIVQHYEADDLNIVHSDLYRLTSPDDLMEIGLTEALGRDLCLVEWPDRLRGEVPPDALLISLSLGQGDEERVARLSSAAPRWQEFLDDLRKAKSI